MAETTPSGQPPAPPQTSDTSSSPPVVVKKYANRRLYNTETSSYITLENLADMIRAGRDFVVYDAKSGDDITRGVLTQIIVEEESKGSAMLPTGFLRQLIGFYGGNLQGVVPRYLEASMSSFARQQQQMRQMVERTFSPFLPTGMEEMNRQNIALFDRAISMWNPFHRTAEQEAASAGSTEVGSTEAGSTGAVSTGAVSTGAESTGAESTGNVPAASDNVQAELDRLRHEIESLRHQLAAAHAAAVVPELQASAAPLQAPPNVLRDPKGGRRAARNRSPVES